MGTAWGRWSPCTPWLRPNPSNAIRELLLHTPEARGGPDPKGGCRSHVAPKKDGGSLFWDGLMGCWRPSCLGRRWPGGLQRLCLVLPSSAPAVTGVVLRIVAGNDPRRGVSHPAAIPPAPLHPKSLTETSRGEGGHRAGKSPWVRAVPRADEPVGGGCPLPLGTGLHKLGDSSPARPPSEASPARHSDGASSTCGGVSAPSLPSEGFAQQAAPPSLSSGTPDSAISHVLSPEGSHQGPRKVGLRADTKHAPSCS